MWAWMFWWNSVAPGHMPQFWPWLTVHQLLLLWLLVTILSYPDDNHIKLFLFLPSSRPLKLPLSSLRTPASFNFLPSSYDSTPPYTSFLLVHRHHHLILFHFKPPPITTSTKWIERRLRKILKHSWNEIHRSTATQKHCTKAQLHDKAFLTRRTEGGKSGST